MSSKKNVPANAETVDMAEVRKAFFKMPYKKGTTTTKHANGDTVKSAESVSDDTPEALAETHKEHGKVQLALGSTVQGVKNTTAREADKEKAEGAEAMLFIVESLTLGSRIANERATARKAERDAYEAQEAERKRIEAEAEAERILAARDAASKGNRKGK